eukprot:10145069-Alexandrium_andersonii.AAC.1
MAASHELQGRLQASSIVASPDEDLDLPRSGLLHIPLHGPKLLQVLPNVALGQAPRVAPGDLEEALVQ